MTAISCGQPSSSGVAWARGEPTNTARSPQLAVRPRSPSAMPRYRCPMVANSWPRGSASPGCTSSRAGADRTKPGASCSSIPSGRSRNRKCRSACSPNGSRSSCTPAGKYPDRCGKLGRPNTGAAPIAVIRFDTSARCSISSTAISWSVLRHRPTASAWSAARPSPLPSLRLNSAYRYWHMIMCSSCAASASSHHRCSRCATTTLGSVIDPPPGRCSSSSSHHMTRAPLVHGSSLVPGERDAGVQPPWKPCGDRAGATRKRWWRDRIDLPSIPGRRPASGRGTPL